MSLAHTTPDAASSLPYGFAWLAEHAIERNLFFEPAFLHPAMQALAGPGVKLCVARDADSGIPLAALPLHRPTQRYGPMLSTLPLPLMTWLHPYAVTGTPLLAPETPAQGLIKLLDQAARQTGGAAVLLLPMLPEDGAVWPVLRDVLNKTNRRYSVLRHHQRAGLTVTNPSETTLRSLLGKHSFQSDKTSQKRLAALGSVTHHCVAAPDELPEALEAFLSLEASGWKGHAGTALRSLGHDGFASEVVLGLAREGRSCIYLTKLDGTPIAATVSLCDSNTVAPVWMPWKTAYDERYARQSAGARVMIEMTADLLAKAADRNQPLHLDSLAHADSVVANRLWRDQRRFVDIVVDLKPAGSSAFPAIVMAERARERAYKAARYARDLVKTATKPRRAKG